VQVVTRDIWVSLPMGNVDKVFDFLLVQFQPNTGTVHPVVMSTQGKLTKYHPKVAIVSTTAHLV
jgi:hypothetical protein